MGVVLVVTKTRSIASSAKTSFASVPQVANPKRSPVRCADGPVEVTTLRIAIFDSFTRAGSSTAFA